MVADKKEYENLRKKYRLPEWKWIEKNFIFKIEHDIPILVQVRRAMADKLNNSSELIDPLVASSESYRAFLERKMLSQQEKGMIFEIYKRLQSLLWGSDKISLEYEEREYAEWIINVKDFWEKIKTDLAKLCKKLSLGWKEYKKTEAETVYHG